MPLSAEKLAAELAEYHPHSAKQEELRQDFTTHLNNHRDNAWKKSGPAVHFTASALIINESRTKVMLTLHRRIGRWFQMGGHVEDQDNSLADAALREAREESGLKDFTLLGHIADLDAHDVSKKLACGTHLDVRFIVEAPDDAEPHASDESDEVAWLDIDTLTKTVKDSSVLRLVKIAQGL